MASIIQIRRDTAANWTANNPILAQGELGFETNTLKAKIGNGTTAWNSLGYFITPTTGYLTTADLGVTVQSYDADLQAIGAITGTTGLLKKTAANTWSLDTSAYITGNQTITFTGDATGSGSTAVTLTLANSGVTAGTYRSVTVDAKGRITSGTNPTTLSGYGITDAQPLDADLTAIGGLTGTTGLLKKTAADTWTLDTNTYITGNQTITFTGDAIGSGSTAVTLTLGNSGVTAGTYRSVTVDTKGRVTAGTNPTTLSGYGITDAQPLSANLTSWSGITTASKQDTLVSGTNIKTVNGNSLLGSGDLVISGGGGGTGTVTSVGSGTGLTGGPITTTGTLSIDTAIVTTLTGVQTLTNKTLTTPTITTPVINAGYTEQVFAVSGTTPALSPANGSIQTWTLTANSTPTAGTWSAGQSLTLMVNDSASGFTITWTSMAITWVGGTAPSLSPASGYTIIELWKVGTTIYGALVGQVV
jgi:hypothetical protein